VSVLSDAVGPIRAVFAQGCRDSIIRLVADLLPLRREVADALPAGEKVALGADRRALGAHARGVEGTIGAGAVIAGLADLAVGAAETVAATAIDAGLGAVAGAVDAAGILRDTGALARLKPRRAIADAGDARAAVAAVRVRAAARGGDARLAALLGAAFALLFLLLALLPGLDIIRQPEARGAYQAEESHCAAPRELRRDPSAERIKLTRIHDDLLVTIDRRATTLRGGAPWGISKITHFAD
jgi:hypothetical protein